MSFFMTMSVVFMAGATSLEGSSVGQNSRSYEQCIEDCLAFAEEPSYQLKACVRACEELLPPDVQEDIEGWEAGDL